MSKESKPRDIHRQSIEAVRDRPGDYCPGCGYYRHTNGHHRRLHRNRRPSMSFTAQYSGDCASEDCTTGRIEAGHEVEYHDDELMHTACAARERRGTMPPLCTECWLHHNGECL